MRRGFQTRIGPRRSPHSALPCATSSAPAPIAAAASLPLASRRIAPGNTASGAPVTSRLIRHLLGHKRTDIIQADPIVRPRQPIRLHPLRPALPQQCEQQGLHQFSIVIGVRESVAQIPREQILVGLPGSAPPPSSMPRHTVPATPARFPAIPGLKARCNPSSPALQLPPDSHNSKRLPTKKGNIHLLSPTASLLPVRKNTSLPLTRCKTSCSPSIGRSRFCQKKRVLVTV